MRVEKPIGEPTKIMPIIATLPYRIILEEGEGLEETPIYDPERQRTVYAGRNDSTSRMHDSASWFPTKSDTKKDD